MLNVFIHIEMKTEKSKYDHGCLLEYVSHRKYINSELLVINISRALLKRGTLCACSGQVPRLVIAFCILESPLYLESRPQVPRHCKLKETFQ